MSLLDDVSIVVTPNGYKAGTLYGVIPTYTEGSEEVTNGDFAGVADGTDVTTLSGWSAYGSPTSRNVVDNKLVIVATGGNQGAKYTTSSLSGTCKLSVDVSGDVGSGGIYISNPATNITTSVGKLEYSFVGSGVTDIIFRAGSNSAGTTSYTNISVKEYTAADMDVTRATAGTRVDEDGLVNYAEVLGDEELTDGGFPTGTSAWYEGTGWSLGNGYAESDGTNAPLDQYNALEIGKQYIVVITVTGMTASPLSVRLGTSSSDQVLQITSDGTYTAYGTAGSTTFRLRSQGFNGKVTNVSVKEVTRDNVPRIDYTGGGCPHILAEPQRTNLIPYSEDFNSWYAQDYVTVTEDTSETTSPSGNNTASKITINSISTIRRLYEIVTTSSGNDYTFTLYAKKGTTDYIRFFLNSNIFDVTFDLTNGTKTVTTGSGSIESVGNDWYRLQATGTSSLTSEVPQIQLSNSASVNDYLYIWGSQFEEGSYATSYIPNFGTAAGVTRNQDIFTRDGIGSLINDSEGVLFVEMAALADDLTFRSISLNDGTNTNSVGIRYRTTSNRINAIIKDGNGVTFQMNFDVSDITQFNKIALKYKSGDNSLYINGTEVLTSSSTFSFTSVLNDASFNRGDGNDDFFGKVKQLQVYNTALTDAQLTSLTS